MDRETTDGLAVPEMLEKRRHATVPDVLSRAECTALAALCAEVAPFRKSIVMRRHG
jgi:hypothetical protein